MAGILASASFFLLINFPDRERQIKISFNIR